jgi:hypothetical protein
MKKSKKILLIPAAIAFTFMVAAMPALAHHSFAAEFDGRKLVTLTGTFDKLEWTNPHAHFYIAVKDESGATTVWNFELASPNVLTRHGWTRNSMKVGDTITVVGYLAKDGSKLANARSVTLADGRKVFAGSSDGDGPPQ